MNQLAQFRKWLTVAAGVFAVLAAAAVAAPPADDPMWDAYQKRFAAAPSGVHVATPYVFVVYTKPVAGDSEREEELRDVRAFAACVSQIKSYAREHLTQPVANVPLSPLFQRRPDWPKFLSQVQPGLGDRINFQGVASRVLENHTVKGTYRYCLALAKGAFDRCLAGYERDMAQGISLDESLAAMTAQLAGAATAPGADKALHQREVGLYVGIGALDLALAYAGQDAAVELGCRSFPRREPPPVVSAPTPAPPAPAGPAAAGAVGAPTGAIEPVVVDPYVAAVKEFDLQLEEGHPLSELRDLNVRFPGEALVLERSADYCRRHGMALRALALYGACLGVADEAATSGLVEKMARQLQANGKEAGCPAIYAEYERLLRQWLAVRGTFPVALGKPSVAMQQVWRSFGRMLMAPAEAGVEPQDYVKGKALFMDGGTPEQVLPLLAAAVTAVPGHADSWNLIGRVLMRDGRTLESVPFLNQALTLNPEHPFARANLAQCCQALGLARLGESLAVAACLLKDLSVKDRERMMVLLQ